MEYQFLEIDQVETKDVLDYLNSNPESNIYHHPFYHSSLKSLDGYNSKYFILLNQASEILAVVQLSKISEFNDLRKLITTRWISKGGALYKDNKSLSTLLSEVSKFADNDLVYTKISNNSKELRHLDAFTQLGYSWYPSLNIIVDLSLGIDALFKGFNKTRRKNIRRLEKEGVKIEVSNEGIGEKLILESYEQLQLTYNQAGLPLIPYPAYCSVVKVAADEGLICFITVRLGQDLLAHRVLLKWREKLFDWYAGSNPDFQKYNANDTAVYESFKYGVSNQFKSFDFGGAGVPNKPYGVRDFKLQFGGELINPGFFYKENNKLKNRVLFLAKYINGIIK